MSEVPSQGGGGSGAAERMLLGGVFGMAVAIYLVAVTWSINCHVRSIDRKLDRLDALRRHSPDA